MHRSADVGHGPAATRNRKRAGTRAAAHLAAAAPVPALSKGRCLERALEAAAGRKPTDLLGPIRMDWPVRGLRPIRAARFWTRNLPKPGIWTSPVRLVDFMIDSKISSTALRAAVFVQPVFLATNSA